MLSKLLIPLSSDDTAGRVTISFGVATARPADDGSAPPGELVKGAGAALDAAKRNGRDRVEIAGIST